MSDFELPADAQAEINAELASVLPGAIEADAATAAAAQAEKPADGAEAKVDGQEPKAEKPKADAKPAEAPKPETPAGKLALQIQAQRRALETQRREQTTKAAELEQRGSQIESLHRQLSTEMELASKDPIAWLQKRHGLSPDDIAHRLLNGGAARPEEAQSKRDREVQELREQLKKVETERQTERHSAARESALAAFEKAARDGTERWPLASKYSAARLREEGMALAEAGKSKGIRLTDEDILDKIEERLTEIRGLTGAAPAAAKPAAKPKGKAQAAPTLAGPATDGATGAADEDVDLMAMGDDERFAYLGRVIRKQLNGAGARN